VLFELAGEHYALEVTRVQEVLDVGGITVVPGASATLRGLFNLRGHVLPVWDLRVLLGCERVELVRGSACILIVEREGGSGSPSGLLVDRVWDVRETQPEELRPTPELGLGRATSYVRGVLRHQDRFLLVLDLDRIFASLSPVSELGGIGPVSDFSGTSEVKVPG
jgi:purine-binding chemotaxis protein CheW